MNNGLMNAAPRTLIALGALLLGACTIMLDTEQKQCSKASDCGVFQGKPTYACEESFCRRVSCADDQECAERGNFVCEDRVCQEAFCSEPSDCAEGTETCVAGRCVDPIFYCFDDKVSLVSEEAAVLRFDVISFQDRKPLGELTVKVCGITDTPCNTPLEAPYTYDTDTGKLEIRGLENGVRYSIRMTGKTAEGLPVLESEYYMQRPVLGVTEESDRFELVAPFIISGLAAQAGTTWDDKKGLVIAEIFGCDNEPLAGVSLTSNRAGTLFYLNGTADPNATETDRMGLGGFVNMEARDNGQPLLHTLTFSYDRKEMFSFSVPPRPGVLTFLNIYMPDYQTTNARAEQIVREE